MLDSPIRMYCTQWCSDCVRAKRSFEKFGVSVEVIDVDEDRNAQDFVLRANRGMLSVPTIHFPDDTVLTEPSASELETKFRELGLVS